MLTLTLVQSFALATPVLHDGSVGALDRAAEASGEALDSLAPTPLAELHALPATVLPTGKVERCDKRYTPGQATDQLGQLEGDLSYGDIDSARARLDRVRQAVGCQESPNASALARLWFLAGISHAMSSDPEAAKAAFAKASVLGLDAWDDNFSPEWKPLFEGASSTQAAVSVHPAAGVAFNGGAHPALPGWNLLSVGDARYWVELPRGNSQVVIPSQLDLDGLDLRQPNADFGALAAAKLGPAERTLVVLDDAVYSGTSGNPQWTLLTEIEPSPTAPSTTPNTTRPGTPWVAVAGGGLTAAGAVIAALGSSTANQLVRDELQPASDAGDTARYDASYPSWQSARNQTYLGYGLAGAGVVVSGVGIAVALDGPQLRIGGRW